MALFNHRELSSKNFMHKILDTNPKGNFIIELENMLSDYENSLDSLSISNIKNIASKYNVDLTNDYLEERKELLFRMLTRALGGNSLNDFEYRKLKHLCNILGLDILVLDKEISKRGTDIYRKKLEEIFADKYVSAEEKAELEQLRIQLKIDEVSAKKMYREAVKSTMDSYTKPIFESEVFSPEDEQRMYNTAKNLGLSLTFPPEIQGKLAKYRQNWEILNGNLPVLKTDMHLQSGEVLHHVQQVNWLEERTETRRVNYSGYTYNTKVIGNLKWKAGTITPHKITQEVWKCIDSGYLFLTSKRIIFNGQHGNKVIPFSKVLHFEPYTNGVQIQKDSGKSPFLEFSTDVPLFATILNQLLGRN